MDLSIIIVNWNSKEYLQDCITSVLTTTHGIRFEIVVIDSASFDGCSEMLRQSFPQVRFIQSGTNLGFAKANNRAFRISRGRNILFLNPDTIVHDGAVVNLLRNLESIPRAGAITCKLLNSDGTVQASCIQTFPTVLNQILDSDFLRALLPASSLWGTAALFGDYTRPLRVDAVSGACLMVKRDVFEQVGLFSEEYFMYCEDIDLSYKIRQAGYLNYYVPDSRVVHFGGGSSQKEQSDFAVVEMRQAMWVLLRKIRGEAYASAYRLSMLVLAVARLALLTLVLPLRSAAGIKGPWTAAFRKWRSILRWSLGVGSAVGGLRYSKRTGCPHE